VSTVHGGSVLGKMWPRGKGRNADLGDDEDDNVAVHVGLWTKLSWF
jgi:hypothetical protein